VDSLAGERGNTGLPLAPRPNDEAGKSPGFKHLAGQVRMDLEPGRIGFMSTQRRESHSAPTTEDCWEGAMRDWRRLSDTACAENREQLEVARTALQSSSSAKDRTAPHWEATNSLQLDSCISRYFELVAPAIRRGPPPVWEAGYTVTGLTASRRSSLPLYPHPPVLENIHPALPQFPAADRSRTERYDGKRDLHFQHAA
jgi:hypothetical protein